MKNKLVKFPALSRAEYDILKVLWKQGRQSIREVHDRLSASTGWAYTTTKTMMDRMVGKSLLSRDNFHGVFLYEATINKPTGLVRFVEFFANRVLETDYAAVVSLFAKNESLSEEEIRELRGMLTELDSEAVDKRGGA
ncbi:MAG: BlaI/MecI/CopY family transcriptional regulator [Calditrichia bacterium]